MEFFKTIKSPLMDTKYLHKLLSINNLPNLCSLINTVIRDGISEGSIYCLWGEFHINREELRDGIRFSLPNCPNALTWTITTEKNLKSLIFHLTINKKEQDQDFIESIDDFILAWTVGLNEHIEKM